MEDIRKVVTFDSVEEFWGLYNNIVPPSQLPGKANYYLFKVGLMGHRTTTRGREGRLICSGRDHARMGGPAEQRRWQMVHPGPEGEDKRRN